MSRPRPVLVLLLVLPLLASCPRPPARVERAPTPVPAPPPAPGPLPALVPVAEGREPSLVDQGALGPLRAALDESLRWLESQPPSRRFDAGGRSLSRDAQAAALRAFARLLADDPEPEELARRVRARFDLLECRGGEDGRVLVTGYFEPVIDGCLAPAPGCEVPVYAPPDDRVQVSLRRFSEALPDERLVGRLDGQELLPYWDRREIREEGRLAGRGLEIAWARDEVDLFFLEVQGSGALRLPDGGERRIGYAAANGRPYRSVGRLLIDEGKVERERMSLQAIRAYLAAHPLDVRRVLFYNPSFVFFRALEGPVVGSLGRPLTPGRSIATDARLFPPGALAFLDTTWPEPGPDGRVLEGAPLRRFVLNQDTGGAIRGPDRADFFWGRGAEAGEWAGRMRQKGRLFFLLPRASGEEAAEPASGAR